MESEGGWLPGLEGRLGGFLVEEVVADDEEDDEAAHGGAIEVKFVFHRCLCNLS